MCSTSILSSPNFSIPLLVFTACLFAGLKSAFLLYRCFSPPEHSISLSPSLLDNTNYVLQPPVGRCASNHLTILKTLSFLSSLQFINIVLEVPKSQAESAGAAPSSLSQIVLFSYTERWHFPSLPLGLMVLTASHTVFRAITSYNTSSSMWVLLKHVACLHPGY